MSCNPSLSIKSQQQLFLLFPLKGPIRGEFDFPSLVCTATAKTEFDLQGAVMASDAFFPFPDCVEIANEVGIQSVIQPGGSIKDQLSIDFCDAKNISMVFTGIRHFKH